MLYSLHGGTRVNDLRLKVGGFSLNYNMVNFLRFTKVREISRFFLVRLEMAILPHGEHFHGQFVDTTYYDRVRLAL